MINCFDFFQFLFWTVVYICAIIIGFRNNTYCIPGVSICINFSWELWIVVTGITNGDYGLPFVIQIVWLILDVAIVITLLRSKPKWAISFACILVAGLMLLFNSEWFLLVSFLDNILMSLLFIIRFFNDQSKWKSKTVAICKLFGTLCATIVNGILIPNTWIIVLGMICLIEDSFYVYLLYIVPHIERGKRHVRG